MEFSNDEPFAKSSPLPLLSNQEPLWTVTGNTLLPRDRSVDFYPQIFKVFMTNINIKHPNIKERTNQEPLEISVSTSGRFPKIGGSAGQRPRRPGHIDYGLHQLANTQPASQSLMRWASSHRSSHSCSRWSPVLRRLPLSINSKLQTPFSLSLSRNRSSQFSQFPGGGIGKNE